jgi:CRP-like cAMP-binding protein
VKVCFTDEKENERIMKFATENSWVIDLESFLNNKPSSFYIQAIEDTEYFRLSQSSYRLLYKVVPQFEKFSIEHWRNGFIALHQRIMQNLSMSAEERYQLFKNKYPGLEQRIPQKLVASYLGVTPEFMGKLRGKYTAQLS